MLLLCSVITEIFAAPDTEFSKIDHPGAAYLKMMEQFSAMSQAVLKRYEVMDEIPLEGKEKGHTDLKSIPKECLETVYYAAGASAHALFDDYYPIKYSLYCHFRHGGTAYEQGCSKEYSSGAWDQLGSVRPDLFAVDEERFKEISVDRKKLKGEELVGKSLKDFRSKMIELDGKHAKLLEEKIVKEYCFETLTGEQVADISRSEQLADDIIFVEEQFFLFKQLGVLTVLDELDKGLHDTIVARMSDFELDVFQEYCFSGLKDKLQHYKNDGAAGIQDILSELGDIEKEAMKKATRLLNPSNKKLKNNKWDRESRAPISRWLCQMTHKDARDIYLWQLQARPK